MLDIDNGISLVKFSATWCAPCKVIAKTIEKLKPEFSEIKFFEVDVDDYPELAKNYKIRSVPTIILFWNGEEVTKLVGNIKIEILRKSLNNILKEIAI